MKLQIATLFLACCALPHAQVTIADLLKHYQQDLASNPRSSLSHYRVGRIFFDHHDYQSAANEFRESINGDGQPGWTQVWSHIYLGQIFDATGQRDRALHEYQSAIDTHDDTRDAQEEAARYRQFQFSSAPHP